MKPLNNTASKQSKTYTEKILDCLEHQEHITQEDLQLIMSLQKQSQSKSVTNLLVDFGIDEESVQLAVSKVSGIEFLQITSENIAEELIEKLGRAWCLEHQMVPVWIDGEACIASSTVDEFFLTDVVRKEISVPVGQILTTTKNIQSALEKIYSDGKKKQKEASCDYAMNVERNEEQSKIIDLQEVAEDADSSPVVHIVSDMITLAVREDSSDIHFEPGADCSHVRFRIDGVLHDLQQTPKDFHSAVVSRLKILANLDISERRMPQDGRIRVKVLGRKIDLRISTVATPRGEKVVLRILDARKIRIGLDELGFQEDVLELWKNELDSPHGIILVTGPTGCGKTTTLYSALQEMDRKRLNISTVEDPVEYELAGITQIQVHDKIDMTFSRALRALLRQDPDVVLLGEIRDQETANVAIQAAMTGHLVLSTLHTNDAPSSLTRLINIGIEPFLVASAVNSVLAQRLARRVCPKCVEMHELSVKESKLLQGFDCDEVPHATGCSSCRGSGYSGRIGVYEFLVMDDELRDAIASNPTITDFRNLALSRGMENLRYDGFAKVADGLTTVDEILRLTA